MRRITMAMALTVVVTLAGACGGADAQEESTSAAPTTPAAEATENVLEPTEAVQVGEFRFVDACQALDVAAVEAIFGKMGPRGDFRARSRTALPEVESDEANGADSECHYDLVDKSNQMVKVQLDQYTTTKAARESWLSELAVANGKLRAQLKQLQEDLGERSDQGDAGAAKDAEEMLTGMQDDLAALERENEGLTVLQIDGTPVIFRPSRSQFFAVQDNVMVQLNYTFGPRNVYAPARQISPRELPAAQRKIGKALVTIEGNRSDPDLSQAPVSSNPSGMDMLGETPILEPCELLTPELFAEVIGDGPYPGLMMESGPRDPQQMLKSEYAAPTCQRHFDEEDSEVSGTMTVTVHHTPSAEAARREMKALCTPSARKQRVPLQVTGIHPVRCLDQANAMSDSGAFAFGPHVVQLHMYDGYTGETFWFQHDKWTTAFELLHQRLQELV